MEAYSRAQAGDADALSALVRRHVPLVQSLCRRFPDVPDAFQAGCVGLVKAIRGFRAEMGYAFSTYAVPVILGEMRAARSHALGWRARAALKRARDYENGVLSRTGRRPSVADAAAHAGISPEELMLLEERSQPPVYDETGDLLSSLPDPRGEDFLLRLCIFDILDRLPRIEGWLLRERFIRLRTQQEIARRLHTRQYSVSRLEKRARQRFIREWES